VWFRNDVLSQRLLQAGHDVRCDKAQRLLREFRRHPTDAGPQHKFGDAEPLFHLRQLFDTGFRTAGDGRSVLDQIVAAEIAKLAGLAALGHGQLVALYRLGAAGAGKLIAGDLVVEPFDMLAEDLVRLFFRLMGEKGQQHHALRALRVASLRRAVRFVDPEMVFQLVHLGLAIGAVGKGRGELQMPAVARRSLEAFR